LRRRAFSCCRRGHQRLWVDRSCSADAEQRGTDQRRAGKRFGTCSNSRQPGRLGAVGPRAQPTRSRSPPCSRASAHFTEHIRSTAGRRVRRMVPDNRRSGWRSLLLTTHDGSLQRRTSLGRATRFNHAAALPSLRQGRSERLLAAVSQAVLRTAAQACRDALTGSASRTVGLVGRLSLGIVLAAFALAVGSAYASSGSQRFFFTRGPNGASCEIDVAVRGLPAQAWCVVGPPHVQAAKAVGVTLTASGDLKTCHGVRCLGNAPEKTPTLSYGRSTTLGPFRCTSLRAGVRCVVTHRGRGFVLSAHGIKRIAG
jgi:hypothetical protein